MIVDRHGTPLAVTLTGGNRHDVTQLLPLLDAVPPIRVKGVNIPIRLLSWAFRVDGEAAGVTWCGTR
ncbi:hypothetical protein Strvi_6362 [Streptomyces violaceusniger Tu 4113]|uniref:Transposase IS4-like domain-containing protein n=1 Tax=Streptomyces violaceusniger (strain Tu 4113) TaxID=653045 RepID=G2P817_STRV4|nr:hypothetical protein Strvi_6362 [Streptomyces violaceusniger Tu 4113]